MAWASEPTLGDGIPEVRRRISETGPSVPGDDEHAEVKWVQKPFGLLDEASFDVMKNILMFLTPTHGALSYGSANDIAGFVKTLVSRIVLGLDLSQLEVHSELGTFNIRPDLWVITRGGVPIGVIQVKKPDVQGEKIQGLDHLNCLGELYDFMRHLPNFYGVSPVFGIITNFVSWRVAWLPDKDGNFDEVENRAAEPVVWFPEEDDDQNDSSECASVDANANANPVEGTSPIRQTASNINPLIHKAEEEDSEVNDEQEEFLYNDDSDRFFHVSKIFHRTDPNSEAIRAIAAAICKMQASRQVPFRNPFDRVRDRACSGLDRKMCPRAGTSLPLQGSSCMLSKILGVAQDLGRGADGRVWLTTTSGGAVCVLKFSLEDRGDKLDREFQIWKKAYPQFKVYRENWCGHPALCMPHFAMVKDEKRAQMVGLVRKSLMTNFAANKMKHNDVYWRNIGIYTNRDGNEEAVVFDMGSVVTGVEDSSWVDSACMRLKGD
eukprot:scaffold29636_cov50-Attheya_sp.AAC.2